MSHSSKKIVASKASIHADEFTRPGKIRQTSAHHAFKTTARGDVKVIIKEQYQGRILIRRGPRREPS